MKKRLMAFLLLLTFIFTGSIGLLPVTSVKAAENPYSKKEKEIPKTDKIYYVEADEDEFIAVQRVLANHEENFTIRYLASKEEDFSYIGTDIWDMFLESDGLYWSDRLYADASFGIHSWGGARWNESYVTARGQKWYSIDYEYNYFDDYSEYQELCKEVRKLIVDSGISKKSDYEKAEWAYDWMCTNIKYDYDYKIRNAYDTFKNKKAVCEGYARLFEVFAGELGLNTRYVDGLGIGVNAELPADFYTTNYGHAWNIIEFDGKWYQLDTTWGAVHGRKYFLKGTEFFNIDHTLSDIISESTLNLASSDFVSSTQNSDVPARLYNINLEPVYMERLNIGEEYNWLISNDTGIKLEFSNSNPSVVSLTDNGKVKALKAGKATLTAVNKELGIKQNMDITVLKEKASLSDNTTIKSANAVSVVYGKTAQIKFTKTDSEGILQNVKYASKDKSIATVDKNGKVTGVKAGTTTISITCDNGSKVTAKVTVKPLVNTKTTTVKVNKKVSLRDAIVISKNGYKDLKFTCKDNMSSSTISIDGTTKKPQVIATVSSDGYVTGKSKGTIKVDVYNKSTNKLLGSVQVTVK